MFCNDSPISLSYSELKVVLPIDGAIATFFVLLANLAKEIYVLEQKSKFHI